MLSYRCAHIFKFWVTISILISNTNITAGQEQSIVKHDNLKSKAESALQSGEYEEALSLFLQLEDYDFGLSKIQEILKKAKVNADNRLLTNCYATYGRILKLSGGSTYISNSYYDSAILHSNKAKDGDVIAKINNWYATNLATSDNHVVAIQKLLENLDYYQKIGDTLSLANTLNRIGNSNNYMGYHNEAIKYYNPAIEYFTALNDYNGIARVSSNISIMQAEDGEYEKSLITIKSALENYKKTKSDIDVAYAYDLVGTIFNDLNIDDSAFFYLNAANEILKQLPKGKRELAFNYQSLGNFHFKKGKYLASIDYYKKALEIAHELEITQLKLNNTRYLSQAYYKLKDYKKAYDHVLISYNISDSIYNNSNTQLIAEMQAKYENIKQTSENEQLKNQAITNEAIIQKQRIYNNSFAAIVAILLIAGIVFTFTFRKIVKQKKIAESDRLTIQKQSDQLAASDKMKSQFFSNISHELRTPLTILVGMLDHLMANGSEKYDKNDSRKLELAKVNAEKIKDLIDEVFELTKMDAHKVVLVLAPTAILPLMERIVFSFHSLAEEKKQDLSISYNQVHNVFLNIDVNKFEKIINNLIINAIKFTPEGGKIKVEVSLKENNSSLEISIIDNGKGISKQDMKHIFDRYFQSENQDGQANPGTGLGLAMAKELTEMQNGEISATSTLGEGTNFKVTFPIYYDSEKLSPIYNENEISQVQANEKDGSTYDILIVEDNPDMREYLKIIFAEKYKLMFAQNGEEALGLLNSLRPNLIISDLMMPKMDGNTFLTHVKQDDNLKSIPVIILTAKLGEESKLNALRLGVDDYITKPFSATEIKIRASNLIKNANARVDWITKHPTDQQEVSKSSEDKFLIELKKYVIENISNHHININTIANHLAMSERQLYRKVGEATGLTPNQLIREIKLQYAESLIQEKSVTKVSVLAHEVGFESASYFSKLYFERFGKKLTDMLP